MLKFFTLWLAIASILLNSRLNATQQGAAGAGAAKGSSGNEVARSVSSNEQSTLPGVRVLPRAQAGEHCRLLQTWRYGTSDGGSEQNQPASMDQ